MIAALGCVSLVTWFDEDTPLQRIIECHPDILVKGGDWPPAVSYTHLRAHETVLDLVCRLLLETKQTNQHTTHTIYDTSLYHYTLYNHN